MPRSSGSSLVWKFLVGILVAILVVLLVAEFGLRWFIGNQLRDGFREDAQANGVAVTEDPSISFGATPLVFSVLTGNVKSVDIDTPSTLEILHQDALPEIKGQPAAHLSLTDLSISDPNNPVAASLRAVSEVPDDYLLATVQISMAEQMDSGDTNVGAQLMQQLIKVTDITSNPSENTIDVEFTDGAAQLRLRPVPQDGALSFEAMGATLFGFDLPEQVTTMITDSLKQSLSEATSEGMRLDNVEVLDNAVRLTLTGNNVRLSEVSSGTISGL
ncbi:DUF2993 domain-containing protein [Corynebacterium testudinoris]|uniref:Putative DUF2993 family protein n=1 Tax=Corynebacterium testudinoris TaxID=136857 RepID=A0A0G3H2Y5_9CORY|nr:DUF2993 domain-containing protein [Corynebacterium testudinoris]AKK07759.1 putative DUF2993 family protein [Corynebacterium testudinoris]MBX8995867.1 DUF2993 domain-containing protein [Corynebacterium testudinoris]